MSASIDSIPAPFRREMTEEIPFSMGVVEALQRISDWLPPGSKIIVLTTEPPTHYVKNGRRVAGNRVYLTDPILKRMKCEFGPARRLDGKLAGPPEDMIIWELYRETRGRISYREPSGMNNSATFTIRLYSNLYFSHIPVSRPFVEDRERPKFPSTKSRRQPETKPRNP